MNVALLSLCLAFAQPIPGQAMLKKAFNDAKGKVRIVMLVSPT